MFLRAFRLVYVSIPLGTINTVRSRTRLVVSSVSIPLGTINTSSFYPSLNNLVVSIPLGTINTLPSIPQRPLKMNELQSPKRYLKVKNSVDP